MFGSGVEKDRSKAASLFKEAADAGDHQAMCHLAGCYKRGAGVEQNIEASKMWYSLYQQKRGAGSVNRVADGSKNITSRHNTL